MKCTNPSCEDPPVPHLHPYLDRQCKDGNHEDCTGRVIHRVKSSMNDQQAVWWSAGIRRRWQGYIVRSLALRDNDYWLGNEKFNEAYWDWSRQRNGVKPIPSMPKVWSCRCTCHPNRAMYTVWSVLKGHRPHKFRRSDDWLPKSPRSLQVQDHMEMEKDAEGTEDAG